VIQLSPEANKRLLAFERELEPELGPGGSLHHLADWGSKLAGAVLRIAGLLHLATNFKTGYREAITSGTFEQAVRIGNYFRAHSIATQELMVGGTTLGDGRVLLDWISSRKPSTFSKREAHRALQSRFAGAAELDPALELLDANGWIRRRPDEPIAPQGGRRPSPLYDVHPGVLDGTVPAC
jgi:hypothetical protein